MARASVVEALASIDESLLTQDGLAARVLVWGQPRDGAARAYVVSPAGEQYQVSVVRDVAGIASSAPAGAQAPSLAERADALLEVGDAISGAAERLARLVAAETGKTIAQAREEVSAAAELLGSMAARVVEDGSTAYVSSSLTMGQTWRAAQLGVWGQWSLVLASFTSPFFTAVAGAAASALAGVPAVVKSPWQGAASALAAAYMFRGTALEGYVSAVHSIGPPAGAESAPLVIAFGRRETAESVRRLTGAPVVANCSGRAVLVLCREPEDYDTLASELVESATWHAGQGCGSVRWVLALRRLADELVESVLDSASQLSVGNPLEGSSLGPLRERGLVDVAARYAADAVAKGARQLGELRSSGNYMWPLVLDEVPKSADVLWRDVLAPMVVVSRFDDCSEALEVARLMQQPTTYVVYGDLGDAASLASSRPSTVVIAGREGSVRAARLPCYQVGEPAESMARGLRAPSRSLLLF